MKSSKRINSRGNRSRRSKATQVAGPQAGGREELVFMGFVNEKVKRGALGVSTALVLTSVCNYIEVFSLAITEAWARCKSIIATTVVEIPYMAKHMTNGILLPPRNPMALAEAITLLTNIKEVDKKTRH